MNNKNWNIINNLKTQISKRKAITQNSNLKTDQVLKILLENRSIKTKKQIEEFLNPKLEKVTISSVGIDKRQLNKALLRIKKAIDEKEQIVVFGDYDVDGICGTAILWETLHSLGAKVLPYIPHRIEEGYGLSLAGISNVKSQMSNLKLIITVDNGIVADEAVEFANKNGIDVIITDHHVPSKKLPNAHSIVHTTKLCGTGVAYLLAKEISNFKFQISNKSKILNTKYQILDTHLELVALATVADLVPLTGANRTLFKFGLEKLRQTKRVGILALCSEAGIDQKTIDTYEIGHIIAPRLNAMGRMEYAMESLRLLCTKDPVRARELAYKLGSTNKDRQLLTQETVLHATTQIRNSKFEIRNLLFISSEKYQQGVIGLVAGKLVEEYYRPAIVVSIGKTYSKASARSVHGFNIIEFIRSASEHLIDAGGHPMAAGFTVETAKLKILQKILEEGIKTVLDENLLTRSVRVDCEITMPNINENLYAALQKLSPFGMGNPLPTFVSRSVVIEDMRLVGRDSKHLKLNVKCQMSNVKLEAIAFGMGERAGEFKVGDSIDVVYTLDENLWNGSKSLQLKVKDIKKA